MVKVTPNALPSAPPPGTGAGGALRRLVFAATAGVSLAAASFSAVPTAAYADAVPQARPLTPLAPLLAPTSLGRASDHLTVTVRGTGGRGDGRFELACHPGGGSHPDVDGACGSLDRGARWGKDPFAPVSPDSVCTMMYGGPATAHVTGTWAGRPVDATFDRSNGCQMARWDRLVPLLPDLRQGLGRVPGQAPDQAPDQRTDTPEGPHTAVTGAP